MTHTEPAADRPSSPVHAQHDLERVAAAADPRTTPHEAAAGVALIATCRECAQVAEDLRLLASAVQALRGAAPSAPDRDYRLRAEDAARLRGGRWRRAWRAFLGRGGSARPLAGVFTTLGVAGLLLAMLPGWVPQAGGAMTTASQERSHAGPTSAPSSAPEYLIVTASPDAASSDGPPSADDTDGKGATPAPQADDPGGATRERGPAIDGVTPLFALSLAFVVLGAGLIVLTRRARHSA